MIEKLKISIDNLYTIFARYGGNSRMDGSPNYGDKVNEWNRNLYSKPLKELSDKDLSRFTGKSMTTWGEVDDYKHFLPRIFELTALYKTPYEIWIAFSKLEFGNWRNWLPEEQAAINDYMISLFENLLNDDSELAELNFVDYFTSISNFYLGSVSLIELWDKIETKASFKHLSLLIIEHYKSVFSKGRIKGFDYTSKNIEELKKWLLRKTTIEKFEKAFFLYEKEDFAEEISWAEQLLTNEIKNC